MTFPLRDIAHAYIYAFRVGGFFMLCSEQRRASNEVNASTIYRKDQQGHIHMPDIQEYCASRAVSRVDDYGIPIMRVAVKTHKGRAQSIYIPTPPCCFAEDEELKKQVLYLNAEV
jgi:hypothetical protein